MEKCLLERFYNEDYSVTVSVIKINGGEKIFFILPEITTALGYIRPEHAIKRINVNLYFFLCDGERYNISNEILEKIRKIYHDPFTIVIKEPAFYEIASRAKTDEGKKFQKWLYSDFLPRIGRQKVYCEKPFLERQENIVNFKKDLKKDETKKGWEIIKGKEEKVEKLRRETEEFLASRIDSLGKFIKDTEKSKDEATEMLKKFKKLGE